LAPSDEAFGLIPGSKLDELKNNAQKRREFILRHIIPGRLILKQFGPNDETEVKSVDNTQLHLTAYPNGVSICLPFQTWPKTSYFNSLMSFMSSNYTAILFAAIQSFVSFKLILFI
jgi:uncharacterized surface protein with fasciclin (FAS1) repeats